MRYTDLLEAKAPLDLRAIVLKLFNKTPTSYKDADGRTVYKNFRLAKEIETASDEELFELKQHFEQTLAYLKNNRKARIPDPFKPSRKQVLIYKELLPRVGQKYLHWLKQFFADDPDDLKQTFADPKRLILYVDEYLEEVFSIKVRRDGLIQFWRMLPGVREIIGDLPVAVFHFTASSVLRSIRRDGLEGDREPVNHRQTDGVYVTTEQDGPAISGYVRRATSHHGGRPVMITIKAYLDELAPDEDDADIQSGATQFVMDHVPPDRIVSAQWTGY